MGYVSSQEGTYCNLDVLTFHAMLPKVALLVREAVSDTSDNKKWVGEPMAPFLPRFWMGVFSREIREAEQFFREGKWEVLKNSRAR